LAPNAFFLKDGRMCELYSGIFSPELHVIQLNSPHYIEWFA